MTRAEFVEQSTREGQAAVSAPEARPFVKWAGGKTALLPELLKRVPPSFGTYHEPFVGGGALFFALKPQRALLSDANLALMQTYHDVQSDVAALIEQLKRHAMLHCLTHYYAERKTGFAGSRTEVAARFIYFNKTGFNGLWRVNRSGGFNVPMGKYTNPTICDEENLLACSRVLTAANVSNNDFRTVELRARPGDFVYFDPPYVPLSKTSNFTAYTTGGFGLQDQTNLRDLALRLKRSGVHVLLSNSSSDVVAKLYEKDFTIDVVECRRNINSKAAGRGTVKEFLIR